MNNLLIGLLGALLMTNQPAAVSNLVTQNTGLCLDVADPNDPVEKEFKQLMSDDDEIMAQVDKWIREENAFAEKGGGQPGGTFEARIRAHFAPMIKAYEDFIARHPDHARARLAYGSFLSDIKDEDRAEEQWDKALALDPKCPAAYNNLANLYGHHGPVKKAFEYYAKAIELEPNEWVYYHNLGDTVFLFRRDAMEYYHIDEQQVFNKALELYRQAMRCDPDNFELAQDVAQTYYGIKPFRMMEAMNAWTNALKLASSDIEKEGVYVHFARLNLHDEHFNQARELLTTVTNEFYATLKDRLLRNTDVQEAQARLAYGSLLEDAGDDKDAAIERTKALALCRRAFNAAPTSFELAQYVALNYFEIKPLRVEEGLSAWTNALNVATPGYQQEGVFVNLAQYKFEAGRLADAREQLNSVTNAAYLSLKQSILRNIDTQEALASKSKPASTASEKR